MSVKEQYRKYSLITIILGLGLLLFLKMTPFMGGILGACTIYIMVRDQMLYLTQKKKIRKSVTAIILLIEAILCFLVPLSLAVWLLISKLQTVNVDTATFVDTITNLADWIRRKTEYDLLSKENISSIASILPRHRPISDGRHQQFCRQSVCFGFCTLLYADWRNKNGTIYL